LRVFCVGADLCGRSHIVRYLSGFSNSMEIWGWSGTGGGRLVIAGEKYLFISVTDKMRRFWLKRLRSSWALQKSRTTVLRLMLTKSAISTKVRPPKKCSSTISAWRGSKLASSFMPSSGETRLEDRSGVKLAASSIWRGLEPEPGFSAWVAAYGRGIRCACSHLRDGEVRTRQVA